VNLVRKLAGDKSYDVFIIEGAKGTIGGNTILET
jgi:hypothetical protein